MHFKNRRTSGRNDLERGFLYLSIVCRINRMVHMEVSGIMSHL